ncbi:transglutaminase domain-containing protein [Mycoplasma putrefaciens]|uniref:MAG6410 family transglutaminase-related lipoprotein n=1 Tax=Mycoplasma putrefaciens TaxID=2123 RepID=UPI003DA677C8
MKKPKWHLLSTSFALGLLSISLITSSCSTIRLERNNTSKSNDSYSENETVNINSDDQHSNPRIDWTNSSNSSSHTNFYDNASNVVEHEVETKQMTEAELKEFYTKQIAEPFKEKHLLEQDVRNIIFKNDLPSNYYSHPDFKLEKSRISLYSKEQKVQLKLLNSKNSQVISSDVNWYQRIRYPQDEFIKAGQKGNSTLNLSTDGTVYSEKFDPQNPQTIEVWAEHKGALYLALVTIESEHEGKEWIAKNKAIEIVKEKGWKDMPTLKGITEAYKWITKEVKYPNLSNVYYKQSAYSALIDRETVCTGYAKAFKMFMDEMGVPCKIITGKSAREISGMKHAWNLVEIDGEWYHVDATSDRVDHNHGETKFEYFLTHDDDFHPDDKLKSEVENKGQRFRNLKLENFVKDEDDIRALADIKIGELEKIPSKLEVLSRKDLYKKINEVLEEKGLEISDDGADVNKYLYSYTSFRKVTYKFKKAGEKIDVKTVDANIEKFDASANYAIKVSFGSDYNLEKLTPKHFVVKNAMIKKVEQNKNSYILHLDHFDSFGNVNVKLESIKVKGYKFNLNNNEIKFEVKRGQTSDVKLEAISDKSVKFTNVKTNLEYRNNFGEWKDVSGEGFVANDVVIGKVYVRQKSDTNTFESDIKVFDLNKERDIDRIVRKDGSNSIIGVDSSMQYRVKNQGDWISITTNKLENLKPATYEIRTKANGLNLASEPVKINIYK